MPTQREAATTCGASRTTIRRHREAGNLPRAVQDQARGWLIPVEDLLATGLRLNAPADPDMPAADSVAAGTGEHQEHGHGDDGDMDELERIRQEHTLAVAAERHGRELAEAETKYLREQLRARGKHIADLPPALRTPTPAPARTELPSSVPGQAGGGRPGRAPKPQKTETAGGEQRRWPRRGPPSRTAGPPPAQPRARGADVPHPRDRHSRRALVGRHHLPRPAPGRHLRRNTRPCPPACSVAPSADPAEGATQRVTNGGASTTRRLPWQ
ncbi:hypothetical protein GCM10010327_70620 [Streptomyces nitrosporeus]|nr:hypothetical protein GCM10010327_70620 [Streptomyces nitrosporeus]